jgi:hypothetical protein
MNTTALAIRNIRYMRSNQVKIIRKLNKILLSAKQIDKEETALKIVS